MERPTVRARLTPSCYGFSLKAHSGPIDGRKANRRPILPASQVFSD
jgi:hypothetical protein